MKLIRQVGMGLAFDVLTSYPQMKEDIVSARNNNKNVMWAGTTSAIRNNWMSLVTLGATRPTMMFLGLTALQLAPAVATMAYGETVARNDLLRLSATPFSQRFEHTQWTYEAQRRGMQSITGSRSFVGNEAGAFAARYGRR